MKVAVVKERRAFEHRVAASPDTVKRMVGMGLDVVVESGAGEGAWFSNAAFAEAGASIAADEATALGDADIVLKVQRPLIGGEGDIDELALLKRGAVLIGLLQPTQNPAEAEAYAGAGIAAFAMELVPRITRAQAMDVLSSQANLAGYKAVVDAAAEFGRAFPMMMTAAGTIKAARILVMGAGVAGLQAIATGRRLGGIVSATDVRAAAKEQVESLGATFITVDEAAARTAETTAGYAREMGEDYQRRQRERITEALKRTDIVICTALIPGRKAPVLLTSACSDSSHRQAAVTASAPASSAATATDHADAFAVTAAPKTTMSGTVTVNTVRFTSPATASALAPGCRNTPMSVVGVPLIRPMKS